MNLQPAKHHEPVTILMVPFDGYSAFPKAVDQLYKETWHPFKLIIVEGNAPESVRLQLESRKKKHRNIQIIYSAHHPRMAEAFNLGLVHVRTSHAFLMHNGVSVTAGWLSNLMEQAKTRQGVLCPYVSKVGEDPLAFLHGFLVPKQLLEEIGLFDESLGTALLGADFANLLKAKGIPLHRDASTVLELCAGALKSSDRKLFKHQWDDPHAHQTLAYFKQKWGVSVEEKKYQEWLAKKRSLQTRKVAFLFPVNGASSAMRIPGPKIDLKSFLQVLYRA